MCWKKNRLLRICFLRKSMSFLITARPTSLLWKKAMQAMQSARLSPSLKSSQKTKYTEIFEKERRKILTSKYLRHFFML